MTVKDIMTLLESPDRVRVIKDGEEIYTLYKVGEGMHLHRCGWRQPDDRGFM